MGRFFNENNPLVSALSDLCDLIILNALFLICSLPIVTIGSSITAAFKVAQSLSERSCSSVVREFFLAFRNNFRQTSVVWCPSLLVFVVLGLYYLMAISDSGFPMHIWLLLMLVICLLLLAVLCYTFPLIGRYSNKLKDHLKNAAILAVTHFPRTVLLMLISVLPAAMLILYPGLFFYLLPFWILAGFAVLVRLAVSILNPVIRKLDAMSSEPSDSSTQN